MRAKFQVEPEASSVLVDPEAYDASEQEFAVSLEQAVPKSHFVVEQECAAAPIVEVPVPVVPEPPLVLNAEPAESEDRWRQELSAKLNHYRSRRSSKEPRFPSLQLKFESEPPPRHAPVEPPPSQPVLTQQAIPLDAPPKKLRAAETDSSARILSFPRLAMAPPRRVDELADPILDRPRILEVPDAPPPPPALGGILIGPVETPDVRPSEFEVPLQVTSLSRRTAATGLDAVVVIAGVVLFADIFRALAPTALPTVQILAAATALFALFWVGYHSLLLIICGTTLGLRLTRMQLHSFDGKPVKRRTRRWRALTTALSTACLGMGYAWCLLDEDQLCWHDRITRTYVGPS